MNRNKQFKEQKEILRLKREWNEIWQAQRNQGWIELEKPIPNGWDAKYVLRDDISRSPYAEELQEVLDACMVPVWSRRKDFKFKEYKSKKWSFKSPGLRKIDSKEYDKLSEKAKKYFYLDYNSNSFWKRYVPFVDSWKLKVEITQSYKTHYREHDEILYQMEAEVEAKLWGKYRFKAWSGYRGMGEWYSYQNKKEKGISNRKLVNFKKAYNSKNNDVDFWNHDYDGYDMDIFPDGKFDIAWYYD